MVPPLRLQTRKRPLSEKIDYSDMIAEETESGKRGRGKARAKSGGGSRGGARGEGLVVSALMVEIRREGGKALSGIMN